MASVGCLGALGVGSRYLKPGKTDHFGYFGCEIQLHTSVAKPFESIRGKLIIETSNEIRCYGIRLQLDATINLKFDTKIDNRLSTHKKMEGLLQDASEPGDGYYILSPIREQLLGNVGNADEDDAHQTCSQQEEIKITLQPGTYTYSFNLTMPGEPLPSPFRSQYGNLTYKIVAYMRSLYCYVQVAEKTLKFRGYNNLSQLPNCFESLKHESGFQKSLFSSKKIITAVLTVEKTGFLPGDDVPFTLTITNPKGFLVRKISLNLIRRVIYNVNGATKTTVINLDSFENDETCKDDEIYCEGKVTVPRNCMPTYSTKPVYSVMHLIQYQVKVAEYPGPLKGQVEVVIGTMKGSVDVLMNRRMSTLQIEDHFAPGPRERSNSAVSRLSDSSMMSTFSLPPAYSQLSSRAVSMLSLETLPPHYDDLV